MSATKEGPQVDHYKTASIVQATETKKKKETSPIAGAGGTLCIALMSSTMRKNA